MTKLKPCPSCKSKDVALNNWSKSKNNPVQGSFIRCYTCQTCGPTAETIELAEKKWNDMPRSHQKDKGIPFNVGDVLYGDEHDDWAYRVDKINEEDCGCSFTLKRVNTYSIKRAMNKS